jgi:serine/threonine protein kinase
MTHTSQEVFMTPARWRQVEELYHAASQREKGQREAFLNEACQGDQELKNEVESLLKQESSSEDLLAWGATPGCLLRMAAETEAMAEPPNDDLEEDVGRQYGSYRTLRLLGRGGMGSVYLAEQRQPIHRLVALKVIKRGMDTREVIARFDSERQALALMDHPNIARVFDAGASEDGRPYFVMEYVPGIPITQYCDQNRLNNRERMELFIPVCHAVQHAHQKGIIHRDIKPSNVLVWVQDDGRPMAKVIDFGVAKATNRDQAERTFFTQHGVLIGTPEYMSPEQAGCENVDATSDIYSLGALLYELLVGVLPFNPRELRGAGFDEIRRVIREEETPRPTTRLRSLGARAAEISAQRNTDPRALERQLRGDLDWITARAMEKDRSRRYASASELASDIERHLRDEPVIASPPGVVYRTSKFVRRHRGAVAGTLAACLALVVSLCLTTAVYGVGEVQRQFESCLLLTDTAAKVTTRMLIQSLNHKDAVPIREALRDPGLQDLLVSDVTLSRTILEVAVIDTQNETLLDSDPVRLGAISPQYPNFRSLVMARPLYEKLRAVLVGKQFYQLEQGLGINGKRVLSVRFIIDPALVRREINPALRKVAVDVLSLVILAACLLFLLMISLLGFRS